MPLSNEFLEEYMVLLAEDEGTKGRKVALEGGGGTRGYGITTIPDELKEYAKTASDEDLARKLVGWHYDKVVGKIGQSTWDNMPNSMKIITVDQHYNSGTLYNGFKTDIISGNYAGALKNTLDIISASDPQTGGKGVMNGLVARRVRNYNRAASELGLSVINQYNIGSAGTGTQVAYNYNDGSNFNVNTKSGIHSASSSVLFLYLFSVASFGVSTTGSTFSLGATITLGSMYGFSCNGVTTGKSSVLIAPASGTFSTIGSVPSVNASRFSSLSSIDVSNSPSVGVPDVDNMPDTVSTASLAKSETVS